MRWFVKDGDLYLTIKKKPNLIERLKGILYKEDLVCYNDKGYEVGTSTSVTRRSNVVLKRIG